MKKRRGEGENRKSGGKESASFVLSDAPQHELLQQLLSRFPATDFGALFTLLAFVRTSTKLLSAMEAHYARFGVSQARFSILMILWGSQAGMMSPSDLARQLGVTPATVTSLLDGLEKSGYVKRERDAEDRRALRIVLTQRGRKFLDKTLPGHLEQVTKITSHFQENDHLNFHQLLELFEAGIDRFSESSETKRVQSSNVVVVRHKSD